MSDAYQILSNPTLRKRYDDLGPVGKSGGNGDDEGPGMAVDAEAMFRQLFGGDAFSDLIGDIAVARMMSMAMTEAVKAEQLEQEKRMNAVQHEPQAPQASLTAGPGPSGGATAPPQTQPNTSLPTQPFVNDGKKNNEDAKEAEKERKRKEKEAEKAILDAQKADLDKAQQERIKHLASTLLRKLDLYVTGVYPTLDVYAAYLGLPSDLAAKKAVHAPRAAPAPPPHGKEAQQRALRDLQEAPHGPALLACLAYVYTTKAEQYLTKHRPGMSVANALLVRPFVSAYHTMRDVGHVAKAGYTTFMAVKEVMALQEELAAAESEADATPSTDATSANAAPSANGTPSANANPDKPTMNAPPSQEAPPKGMTPEMMASHEEKIMKAMWRTTRMDVEFTLRAVIDQILDKRDATLVSYLNTTVDDPADPAVASPPPPRKTEGFLGQVGRLGRKVQGLVLKDPAAPTAPTADPNHGIVLQDVKDVLLRRAEALKVLGEVYRWAGQEAEKKEA